MAGQHTVESRTGRPPVTSRAELVEAARRLIDRDGWEKLTIRRLAAELGIGASTAYHHVRNKQDLLLLLLNDFASRLEAPDLPEDPRERIITAGTAMHDLLAEWPWVAEVITADGFIGLLDESALRPVEVIVGAAVDYGCTHEQAIIIFRALYYYTAGEILVRAHTARAQADEGHITHRFDVDNLNNPRLPTLAALRHQWGEVAARDTFAQCFEAFVDGLLAQTTGP
jgi:AcrR family transcriptional regulator